MARHPFQRRGNTLVPTTQDGRDALNRIDHGADVMVSWSRARNMRQHNLFWALCDVGADHFDITKDAMKEELCIATGECEPIFYSDGSMKIRAKSIACENMEPEVFEAFFRLAVRKLCDKLGSAPQEVIDHVISMIDPQSPPIAPGRERVREDA